MNLRICDWFIADYLFLIVHILVIFFYYGRSEAKRRSTYRFCNWHNDQRFHSFL